VLTKEDQWVGEAITSARIAYECWTQLLSGEIKIEPESSANLVGGSYANVFANYAKGAFLGAVAVLHRGLFKMKKGVLVKKKTAYRMLEAVSDKQMDELLKLTAPSHSLRDKDQHKEGPGNLPVWSIRINQGPPTIGTFSKYHVDPAALYELLKSLEPAIGYVAFIRKTSPIGEKSDEDQGHTGGSN
jgi:hypothetical protein